MKPRASFVIPAHNAERWLSKAILSCRNQTIKQIEVIVIDDGSTDWTYAIAKKHVSEDSRVKVFRLEKNVGRSEARNFGNKQVSSDIILVLDADDMASRNRVKDTIAAFELKKADLVYGSFFVIDSLGNTHGKVIARAFDEEEAKKTKLNYICHSTMSYTKELSEKINYSGDIYSKLGLDDWKFQWDAFRSGAKFAYVRSPLAYYRQTEDGISAVRKNDEVEAAKVAYLA